MSVPDLYAEAVARVKGGWSVIPIRNDPATGGKLPACKTWSPYKTRLPTREEVHRLFSQGGLTGLAGIAGRVSGGLYFRDFDVVASYQRWAAAHPDLAGTLPTYQTGRGFQVVAYYPELVQTRDLGDGELRGENHYSVLPPSLHPTGVRYAWRVAGPDTRITLDPVTAGLARPWSEGPEVQQTWDGPEREQRYRESENLRVRDPEEVREHPLIGDAVEEVMVLTLPDLIQQALPTHEHQNHGKLFFLARGVKALEKREGRQLSQQELEMEVFGPWYEQNQFLRPGQSREQYLGEFLMGYGLVRCPIGEGLLEATWENAGRCEPPPAARQFASPHMRRLVAWCFQLQLVSGEGPFFLSVRTVATKLGLGSPKGASAALRRLVEVGILAEVEKGGPSTNRATRFRYLCQL